METATAIIQELISIGARGLSLCTAPTESIEMGGVNYVPDGTKGYISFEFSHAFPVVTAYGHALHPNVIAKSFQSLKHQSLNYEHMVAAYDPEKNQNDRYIGTILDAEFPKPPDGGYRVQRDKASSPGIRAVASFSKLAKGMAQIVGKHKTGRHTYSTSMEVLYDYQETAFAIEVKGKPLTNDTPSDIAEIGWDIIPWANASPALTATFSKRRKKIIGDYRGRKVVQLMGGLGNQVHYSGAGLVLQGAESEAHILSMAASLGKESPLSPLFALLSAGKSRT